MTRDLRIVLVAAALCFGYTNPAGAIGPVDSIPCSGTSWTRNDDTATAKALAQLAVRMMSVADSANAAANVSEEGPDATPEFFTSAAEIARRAAAFGPDHLRTLMTAANVTNRASARGEVGVDTVLAKRAECYASRALNLATKRSDQVTATRARTLLQAIRRDLMETRKHQREAEAQRLRNP